MVKRYLSRIKQYGWIVLVCTVLATLVGLVLVKAIHTTYQATSTMLVIADAPADGFDPSLSTNDSIGLANNYAGEITSLSIMEYVYQFDPQLAKRGYTPDDLLSDVTTVPSATTSTFQIIASVNNPDDAALMANDVANGFAKYIQTQNQNQLNAERTNLSNQLATAEKQKAVIEANILTVASNTDPHFYVYQDELTDEMHTIDSLEGQLQALPPTASSDLAVIQLATAKSAVQAVKSSLVILVTAGIGLLIGILLMLLMIYLDNRLQGEEQVSEKLGMAYLGGVQKSSGLEQNPVKLDDAVAAEFTDIGANLRLAGILPDRKQGPAGSVLLVTSAQPSEGKTTVATALAKTLASAGTSVLVIDGNLRHPATHLAFGMNGSRIGLSGLLKSLGNISDAVQRTNIPGIWLLSGGAPVEAPALVLEQNLPTLLARLREKMEVIIIDGPATLSGSEASILASMADGVLLVVDARHDRLPLLLRTKEILNSLVHVPTGVVMNFFSRPARNSYFATSSPVRAKEQWVSVQANGSNGNGNGKEVELLATPASAPATVPIHPAPANLTPASNALAGEMVMQAPQSAPNTGPASLIRPPAPTPFSMPNRSQKGS